MKQVSSGLKRRALSFAVNNPLAALIIPVTVLAVVAAVFVGEQGAIDYLGQRSASLQADIAKPLNYGDLDAVQIVVLIVLASAAAVLPAVRFYQFLSETLKNANALRDSDG
ncbi:hypothetical protein [Microvirga terricola]|uniref:ABC transporter permease n=1 Tax=Microvirga terricola TaxID=2719797 RepID=A0ABX0VBR3_9HYPH|nr:hypothetical protein [Microvirga terricola]NIX77290.1 hypothetical protein [Microvirga terricola]